MKRLLLPASALVLVVTRLRRRSNARRRG